MIDWLLFMLMLGGLVIVGWAAYREGVNEGWRQAGRWADDQWSRTEARPATRDDDEPLGV